MFYPREMSSASGAEQSRESALRIAAVGRAYPPHYHDQDTLLAALRELWGERHYNLDRLERMHRNVLVGGRHLALPIEAYRDLDRFGAANDAWIRVALEVGAGAVEDALTRAGLSAPDVDALWFTTVTGLATPSLDALLCNRMPFRPDLKRVPMFGLGCMAGAAGLARAADYVRGFPDHVAVLLAVELCSLTLQREDLSVPNLIASGLFGDGGAAAVVCGERREAIGPRVVATHAVFYPETEEIMGWRISETGFRLVLSAELPALIRRRLRADVDTFLARHELARADVRAWICHPGGPAVLDAIHETLELPEGALDRSWKTLRETGNLSSASVLMVLRDALDANDLAAGDPAVILAMGPGFSTELVLVEW
jgi:alkylresorcinol/alkylpyrone synthase